jgi:hypothetical protein
MTRKRLIATVLEVEGEPTIYVHSPLQAQTVQAWALEECPGATAQDSDVALPDGRVLRIMLRRTR